MCKSKKNAMSPRHSAYIPPSVKSPLRITFISTDKKTQFSEAAFSSPWKEIKKLRFLWLRETLLSELLTIFMLFNVTLFKTYFFFVKDLCWGFRNCFARPINNAIASYFIRTIASSLLKIGTTKIVRGFIKVFQQLNSTWK